MNQMNHCGKSESDSSAPESTMELLQNELTKKWEREQAEKEREERLADEPLGPDKHRTLFDDQAFYDFHGGVEEGDRIEWEDGEVNEVIAVVPAQQTFDPEGMPLGDLIHVRVTEASDNVDQYKGLQQEGEQNCYEDFVIGMGLADGTATIHSEN